MRVVNKKLNAVIYFVLHRFFFYLKGDATVNEGARATIRQFNKTMEVFCQGEVI